LPSLVDCSVDSEMSRVRRFGQTCLALAIELANLFAPAQEIVELELTTCVSRTEEDDVTLFSSWTSISSHITNALSHKNKTNEKS